MGRGIQRGVKLCISIDSDDFEDYRSPPATGSSGARGLHLLR
jgi:hypothetical protein